MDILFELGANIIASVFLLGFGFAFGKYRERRAQAGKVLEMYDFYPFTLDERKVLFFDLEKFRKGVEHFLRRRDNTAAAQLLLIGQQNNVENSLSGRDLTNYRAFYGRYSGDRLMDDTNRYLENYKRIVRLIGESFPGTGIEILLHNLSNPSSALAHLENDVTGRKVGAPATNLVHDLKMRRENNQDKLNYELNIGARRFKCTTIPIYRDKFGLVGAICMNVDYNYLDEEVRENRQKLDDFLDRMLKVDMKLDENILSTEEYDLALEGKRHFQYRLVG